MQQHVIYHTKTMILTIAKEGWPAIFLGLIVLWLLIWWLFDPAETATSKDSYAALVVTVGLLALWAALWFRYAGTALRLVTGFPVLLVALLLCIYHPQVGATTANGVENRYLQNMVMFSGGALVFVNFAAIMDSVLDNWTMPTFAGAMEDFMPPGLQGMATVANAFKTL